MDIRSDHVTARLAAWLGGETSPEETTTIETHLSTCAACRTEADALRAAWEVLDKAAVADADDSVWPAVRARTTGRSAPRITQVRHPVWRGALAAAAVGAGVLLGSIAPDGSTAVTGDDRDVAAWLEGSSWADEDGAVVALWLDADATGEEKP